jgi:hypothetical protein
VSLLRKGISCGGAELWYIRRSANQNRYISGSHQTKLFEVCFPWCGPVEKHSNLGRDHHAIAAASPPVSDPANRRPPRVPRSYMANGSSTVQGSKRQERRRSRVARKQSCVGKTTVCAVFEMTATHRAAFPSAELSIQLGDDSAGATRRRLDCGHGSCHRSQCPRG